MLNGKTVAVVVPAYNEESQIGMVIETMPDFVDRIVVVNDGSTDRTEEVVRRYFDTPHNAGRELPIPPPDRAPEFSSAGRAGQLLQEREKELEKYYPPVEPASPDPARNRIILLNHGRNCGKGAGIITGYKYCRDQRFDCIGSMDGDGQMDPDELESLCRPVVCDGIDYVKGNRLIHRTAPIVIPQIRFLGNSVLSILTKAASGYWHVSDTQTGYNVISLRALQAIEIHKIYRSYGYPNDMLVKLNIAQCTVNEVEIKPVYHVGEQSKMKIRKVMPRIACLLFRSFFIRMWQKYLFRDFHPLFLLYHFSFLLLLASVPYLAKILYVVFSGGHATVLPVLAFLFLFISGIQFLLFGMLMDMQDNERLYK